MGTIEKVELHRFMSDPANKLAVLSSIGPDGPQSALVGVAVTKDLELIFDTVKASRKYPNLVADPRCSFVIGLAGDTTVQYEGVAEELPLDHAYKATYFGAFPDGPSRESWPGIVYFLIRPKWIRFADYGDTPPRIEELRFP